MPFDSLPEVKVVNPYAEELKIARRVEVILSRPEAWCKKEIRSNDGRLCLYGAVVAASGAEPGRFRGFPLPEPAVQVWRRMTEMCGIVPTAFNDALHTTHDDIVAFTRIVSASFE